MSNLVNIQRDSFITDWNASTLSFPTAGGEGALTMNSTGVINDSVGLAKVNPAGVTIAANQWTSIGVFLRPNEDDYMPIRIKARCNREFEPTIVVGFGPASPTGSADAISNRSAFPFSGDEFDEIVLWKESNGTLPIAVALALRDSNSGVWVQGSLSAQALNVAPPQMSMATS